VITRARNAPLLTPGCTMMMMMTDAMMTDTKQGV
jgi:hypothetical protein